MEVTGEVVKVTQRYEPHGSVWLTVTIAREGTHDIPLKYLYTSGDKPRQGQVITVSGVPLVGYKNSNIGAVSVTVLQDTPEIKVTRTKLVNARPGMRDPGFRYDCYGPDGTKFDNDSIVALRDVLRRKYGRGVRITETWKAAA